MKVMETDGGCSVARARFSEALDGALAPRERGGFEAHLAACSGCSAAYAGYTRDLRTFDASLHRLVAGEAPRLPFPREPGREPFRLFSPGWLRPAALAAAALTGVLLGLRLPSLLPGHEAVAPTALARRPEPSFAAGTPPCPWREASVREVERTVSYPVVATECLHQDFELVEASVVRGKPCGENVRLTYRAGARSFVLEQHPGSGPQPCTGERVLLDEVAGCFDGAASGTTSLRWAHDDQLFHLKGDVAPAEAIAVARAISQDFERF